MNSKIRLTPFYVSQDRVLGLLGVDRVPPHILSILQAGGGRTAGAMLASALGPTLLESVSTGGVKTLQQLAIEGRLSPGAQFIYNGHFYGKGFGATNRTGVLTLSEKLDEPLVGRTLQIDFTDNGLINDTSRTRMGGSTRLFAFAYIGEISTHTVKAIPYVIGDLVDGAVSMPLPFAHTLETHPQRCDQFSNIDYSWMPTQTELKSLKEVPEQRVKELICRCLGETAPKDWGGEECDLLSANLVMDGSPRTAAFMLKGPARFHKMTLSDCGKNGDQIYRMFNIPADLYVVQHCHLIGPAVRKTVEAFTFQRNFLRPCQYMFIDGTMTLRLLKAYDQWCSVAQRRRRGAAT